MNDLNDRLKAAAELDKNVMVIAGAGTGKTTLLIDRLLFLILGQETPVDKIVALTFTKKAAEEMRIRLETRLRDLSEGRECFALLEEKYPASKPRWPELARRALDNIPKAQIGTIHSFASHLLRLYPLQAGVDPKFREDDGSEFEKVFEREWLAWAARELGDNGDRTEFWGKILRVAELADLRQLAEALVSPLVDLSRTRGQENIQSLAGASLEELILIQNRFPPSKRAVKFSDSLAAVRRLFESLKNGQPAEASLENLIDRVDSPPAGWEEAAADLKRLKNRAKTLAGVENLLLDKVVEGLRPLVECVRSELRRQGAVSFDGLLAFSRDLVRDHRDVRRALKKRFAVFLVDEFQDTDPLQGEILAYLAEDLEAEAADWRDVRFGPGRLFVVGDPKQSIYRFRGADISAFEEFQQMMEKQGAFRARLSTNFRSHAPILRFVNNVFPHVMEERPFVQPPYLALEPHRMAPSDEGPAVFMITVGAKEEIKLKAAQAREAEAAAIADWIKSNVSPAGLRHEQIALLFRGAAAFRPYLEAFRVRGISYIAEGEKSFYRTPEVGDFLNLLSAIDDPSDKFSLVGVLRSPVGGLTDGEILKLKIKDSLNYLEPPKTLSDKIAPFFETLRELHAASRNKPVPELINEVFNKTWILEVASQAEHGEQSIANLQKIRLLAEKWGEGSPLTLASFVRRFTRYRDDEKDEGENPLADVKYDAVKVMTIHKAKGLEFSMVFLPNLSGGKNPSFEKPALERDWRTGRVGLRLVRSKKTNASMVLVEEEIARREKAEEVRVFYVAATRARKKMVFLVQRDGKNNGNFASYLKQAGALPLNGTESIQVGDLAVPVERLDWSEEQQQGVRQVPRPLPPDWNARKLAAAFDKREAEYKTALGTRIFYSPTLLMREPDKKVLSDEERLVLDPDPIQVGVVCHKVMEEWDFKIPNQQILKALERGLDRAGKLCELAKDNPSSERVLEESRKILSGFFSSPAYDKLTRVKILGREIPFVYPYTEGGEKGTVMHGVIDLLYQDKGRWVIADYKTNRLDNASSAALRKKYAIQGKVYQEAIEKAAGIKAVFELIFLRSGEAVPSQNLLYTFRGVEQPGSSRGS